jgi:AraC family transcriptional regulator
MKMACSISILLRTPQLVVGRFRCTPDDQRWQTVNAVTAVAHVVFPWTSVVIEQIGSEAVLANPNHVLFFNPAQRYRRMLHDRRGDDAIFVELAPEVVASCLGGGEGELPFRHGPSDARAYLLHHAAVRDLLAGPADTLYAEELVHEAVARSIGAAAAFHRVRPRPGRDRTEVERHRLVEAAKSALTEDPSTRTTLGMLARRLHTSEFHLARVFHDRTGFTLHAYRTHLRLRIAVERLAQGEADLASLGRGLGFSSHSHFSSAFRSVFGVQPSVVRGVGRRGAQELRRIVEAPLAGSA